MKALQLATIALFMAVSAFAQKPQDTEDWSRQPSAITPVTKGHAPSDAIILYSGKKDIDNWVGKNGKIEWSTKGKALEVKAKTGMISTKQGFGDMQLHIEWRSPKKVVSEGQGRGNSGVFLMGKYEIQVLDSYHNKTYYNGQAGSVYKQHIPLVNACRKPGKWQTYDIFFTAPKFNADKSLKSPAYVTVIHNGVLIQNHVELQGPTEYIGKPSYKYHEAKLPIKLQDHGNPVAYRNIWVRELSDL
ncbi:DUF1080 domain-containing protein [Puteibacter caeruleilacunae]|nr:DUF1080 domain-containing protein [Puteibacter caeruleilacunae]